MLIKSFFKLMRFDKPVGIMLLWWPTAWALWIAAEGTPPIALTLLFFTGTVLMRAAGCVINDIADHKIDAQVKRTQTRPLAQGELSLKKALLLFGMLLLSAASLLLFLPLTCFYLACCAALITIIYPFCKRIIQCPQLVLGLAFSMGIPMAFAALGQPVSDSMGLLCLINWLWILAYDTQYAMVDREDDLRIGVNSTAIFFGKMDIKIVGSLQVLVHILWLFFAKPNQWSFYLFWTIGGVILIYQGILFKEREPKKCFQAFLSNGWYGFMLWLSLLNF